MPQVHGRTAVFIVAALAATVLVSCVTPPVDTPRPRAFTMAARTCPGGNGHADPDLPIICIAKVGNHFEVYPKTIEAHNFDSATENEAVQAPVVIQWVRNSGGGELEVRFTGAQNCVTQPVCANGRCRAETVRTAPGDPPNPTKGQTLRRCDYDVFLDGVRIDPEVVITECCSS